MTDKMILQLLKSDPQAGLSAVVDKYSAYILKIVRIKLNDICTAEDMEEAVSDIFLEFFLSGKRCGFEINGLKSYIAVIARRHCAKMFAKHTASPETIPFDETEKYISVPEKNTDHDLLISAVSSLGQPDEEIFIRKYFLGQKTKDIAKEMRMKENTVDKRISRGLVRLKKILEEGSK